MNENLLSSYSFLASLNENGTDLYKAVYIPMCKRAISLYAKQHTAGTDQKIQEVIKNSFSIDIPLLVTRKLICRVYDDLSRRDKEKFDFKLFEQGKSFQFKSFAFDKIEECYEKEQRKTNALQCAFETFIKDLDVSVKESPTFSSFILRNKKRLSSFLSGKVQTLDEIIEDESYMQHARFLQFIEKNNDELYNVVKRIFVGSIIASYIEAEVDVSAKSEDKISYYLDTKVVLEALDLQEEENTIPTKELLSLIENTGGIIRILDVTIAEIHSIIEGAIRTFNKETPTTTINEACVRNGKNKTWLTLFNGNLEKNIVEQLHANISKVSESDIAKYSESEDVKLLKQIWFRKNAAEHDVIAYLYVRDRRKQDSNKKIYQKASCWFVTENGRLCSFNISRKLNGYANEVILPHELTSLLFLKNPQKYSPKVSSIALNELIAQTITEEYPSKDIINEFDIAIRDNTDITGTDYECLVSEISQFSTTQLQKLLEKSVSNQETFRSDIHNIIAKSKKNKSSDEEKRKKQRELVEQEKNELIQNNQELIREIAAISQQLTDSQTTYEAERQQRDVTISQYKLADWKRPRYLICFVSLMVCIVIFIFYFSAQDWSFNYPTKLLNWIDSLSGIRNRLAMGLLCFIHAAVALLSINGIISLSKISISDNRNRWFLKLLDTYINKDR